MTDASRAHSDWCVENALEVRETGTQEKLQGSYCDRPGERVMSETMVTAAAERVWRPENGDVNSYTYNSMKACLISS